MKVLLAYFLGAFSSGCCDTSWAYFYVDDITYNACLDSYEGSVTPEEAVKICI